MIWNIILTLWCLILSIKLSKHKRSNKFVNRINGLLDLNYTYRDYKYKFNEVRKRIIDRCNELDLTESQYEILASAFDKINAGACLPFYTESLSKTLYS